MPRATGSRSTNNKGDEGVNPQRKCSYCYIAASEENPLRACSKCRAAMYCSRECQVEDWKKHKKVCIVNVAQAEHLAIVDLFQKVVGIRPQNPGRISMVELDQNLEKWIKFHNQALMLGTIHGLKLPVRGRFSRARTHTLRLAVSFNEHHGGNVGKYFNLDAVEVLAIERARMLDTAWKLSLDQVKEMREDAEAKGRGVIVAAAIECKPLAVQIVPIGSVKEMYMKRTKWIENWEENLRRCAETGDPKFEI